MNGVYLPKFFEILIYISNNKGIILTQLAQEVNMPRPSTWVVVNDLEKLGYITKVISKKNRLKKLIYLTDKGKRYAQCLEEIKNGIIKITREEEI